MGLQSIDIQISSTGSRTTHHTLSPSPQPNPNQHTSEMDYITQPFDFLRKIETQFDEKKSLPWMHDRWHWSFYFSALYLLLIYLGQRYMKDKKAYNLRRELCMWSTLLAGFSIYACIRILPVSYFMVKANGWQHAICDSYSYVGSSGAGIWSFIFPFSKLFELFDTAFIVLRKQKLSFLHSYHHVSVFIYCWYSYAHPISTGIWFGIVNFFVHSVMYTYYAVKASGRSPPRWVAKTITVIQLSQMFVGVFINYVGITSLLNNVHCNTNWFAIAISIFFYVSYAILFANFFYRAYISRPASKSAEKANWEKVNGATVTGGSSNGVLNGGIPNGGSSTPLHRYM